MRTASVLLTARHLSWSPVVSGSTSAAWMRCERPAATSERGPLHTRADDGIGSMEDPPGADLVDDQQRAAAESDELGLRPPAAVRRAQAGHRTLPDQQECPSDLKIVGNSG